MPTDDTNFEDELRALMAAGRKIEAIKRYRAATGAGLADAKNAVEALEGAGSLPPREPVDSSFEDKVLSLMRQGQKIGAIKLYREKTGVGLKEAKDFIEALAADQGIAASSRSGCLGVVLLLVLIPLAVIVLGCGKGDKHDVAVSPSKQPTLADALAVIKSKQFIDLTHAFEPGIPYWPGFPDEKRETLYWYDSDKGPEAGAIVVATFPKPKGGSGFPARVFAIVP